jgi:hypothetical protein
VGAKIKTLKDRGKINIGHKSEGRNETDPSKIVGELSRYNGMKHSTATSVTTKDYNKTIKKIYATSIAYESKSSSFSHPISRSRFSLCPRHQMAGKK